jgi:hypothetical protein
LVALHSKEIVYFLFRGKHFLKLKLPLYCLNHKVRLVIIDRKMNKNGFLTFRPRLVCIPKKGFLLPTATDPAIISESIALYHASTVNSVLNYNRLIHFQTAAVLIALWNLQKPFYIWFAKMALKMKTNYLMVAF